MNDAKINKVKEEMNRLKNAIDAYVSHESKSQYAKPIESGAVKRASMDLTRALAELRKPDY